MTELDAETQTRIDVLSRDIAAAYCIPLDEAKLILVNACAPTLAEFVKDSQSKMLSIVGCARCHGTGHDDLLFQALLHPVVIPLVGPTGGKLELSHWALCPTTGEPILLAIVEDDVKGRLS